MAVNILNQFGPKFIDNGFSLIDYEVYGRPIFKSGDNNSTYIGYDIQVNQRGTQALACMILQVIIEDTNSKVKYFHPHLFNVMQKCKETLIAYTEEKYSYTLEIKLPTLDELRQHVLGATSPLN